MNLERDIEFLNTYDVLEELGSGSGGVVYKAYHKRLQKDVVVKRIKAEVRGALNDRAETDILKNLRHSYLPQVLDFLEYGDELYTVMDFIPGKSFQQLADEGVRFTQKQILKYATQLYEALDYLHTRPVPILHGDIKPDNLMLTPEDNICLIDFNISGMLEGNETVIKGYTPGYASPEQIADYRRSESLQNAADRESGKTSETVITGTAVADSGADSESAQETVVTSRRDNYQAGAVDVRSDLYSAAATIYFLLTGRVPIPENGQIRPPREVNSAVTEGFNYIIRRAMAQDPADRFPSSEAVLKALRGIQKLDGKYKGLVRRQNILFAVIMIMIAAGALLAGQGRNLIRREQQEKYSGLIERMSEENTGLRQQGVDDSERFEQLYLDAIAIDSINISAYYQKALHYYYSDEYEEGIEYIYDDILSRNVLTEQEAVSDIYGILGRDWLEMNPPDYQQAEAALTTAIERGGNHSTNYRDLAIAQAKLCQIDEARETLQEAKEAGLSAAELSYAEGEIASAAGKWSEAVRSYNECIALSKDNEMTMRAYLGINTALLSEDKTPDSLLAAASSLNQAMRDVPAALQLQILQSQAQNYIDLYDLTGDEKNAEAGIEVLQRVVQNGWADYSTWFNIAFLQEQMADYSAAEETLTKLLELYPGNYNTYKRLAFLEVDLQNSRDAGERDYSDFQNYYREAVQLYSSSGSGNDMEMQLLTQMEQAAIDGGWLSGEE